MKPETLANMNARIATMTDAQLAMYIRVCDGAGKDARQARAIADTITQNRRSNRTAGKGKASPLVIAHFAPMVADAMRKELARRADEWKAAQPETNVNA